MTISDVIDGVRRIVSPSRSTWKSSAPVEDFWLYVRNLRNEAGDYMTDGKTQVYLGDDKTGILLARLADGQPVLFTFPPTPGLGALYAVEQPMWEQLREYVNGE
jgi:hypothetical protein